MILSATTPRADLEVLILENDILPCATSADCAAIAAMTDAELLAAVSEWVESGNEAAPL